MAYLEFEPVKHVIGKEEGNESKYWWPIQIIYCLYL